MPGTRQEPCIFVCPKSTHYEGIDPAGKKAAVEVNGETVGAISEGLLVFVGIEDADSALDAEWLSHKIVNLRIFDDAQGIPNISIREAGGNILLVSQFTLHAAIKKGTG